ncbi:HesA/MoeB/ThiF family protein [Ignisphaera sp. 4213-co]|uniref:HesA/MoeB/ThiF family protein n=1 Tax=Ignisphaera cupida TaxID=3050454 RepID=A0ABD4ZAH7_9CREN|nr:HesA/MoeB/ThiF family protein [Ignisphaera sp. 4213-co]MDK6029093.1 HesA/MoeB/ThiF family protein [Ignisphaera sp. 4213-co]
MMLDEYDISRYDRQIRVFGVENQEKLRNSTVLVVGAGGLGSAVLTYLTYMGIGKLMVVDEGIVELSNLNRQILYNDSDIGKLKADVVCRKLKEANPRIYVECFARKFDRVLGEELVKKADVVIDALDNWDDRLLLNELCVKYKKPLIHAGVEGWYGQITTVLPGKTPCLYCIKPSRRRAKSTIPVVGVTPGVLGVLEAAEAIKVILNLGQPLYGRLLLIDLYTMEFRSIEIKRNPLCPVCSILSAES